MIATAKRRPLCKCCGAPIPKRTHNHWFGRTQQGASEYSTHHIEKPADKAAAQRLVNGIVVSVSRSYDRSYIDRASVWDGESYQDGHFCRQSCAVRFAYAMARHPDGWALQPYHDAMKERA